MASKNLLLVNGNGMDDEIEPGRTAQTPKWWIFLAVVAAMGELETTEAPWKCDTSQVLDVEHRADSKITGNIKLIGTGTKPPQNFVWTPASSMKFFQSFQWKPL